jgi:hypothetical protein
MVQKTKIALFAVLMGLSLASPAHSQAFSLAYGTGNLTPSYFGDDGGLKHGYPPEQEQVGAPHRNGLNAYARATTARLAGAPKIHNSN